ncbi:alkylmercury lyase family protein [Streptomyces sp. A3M-1-3]|uniref:alkylmercury lyase family protein n=1 Tax=Streptomyces sp. A3M-1-3 TaxID=2962044 RepID=UPI0020B74A90|nr:alkylmercury lyase family protein [Streptomyces sp. A3M-1-3]MCP3822635.1 alkylmercury lyase family protein [Streptomyces sp. A3M-1-3]
MRITIVTVAGCPNAALAQERVAASLGARRWPVELVEVTNEQQAQWWGMRGSPTILINGSDPFADAGTPASVACRLYRGPDGGTDKAPSVADLRRALDIAEAATVKNPITDTAGRAGRGRIAPLDGGLRAVQQAVLQHFATTGRAPERADLEETARSYGRSADEVLDELAAEDFLTLDADGRIRAAYPFSAVPTAHQVRLADGTRVWSMCAVDALGIPAMLGTDAVISSADPVTGESITVTCAHGSMTWEPATAVVFVGQRTCTGPAAEVTCDALNFFATTATAGIWAEQHPEFSGEVVGQGHAAALGQAIFGPLLGAQA